MAKIVQNDGLTLFEKVVANLEATINPGELIDGAGETTTGITATGAAFGDHVFVAAPYDLQGIRCFGWVSAANTVKVRFENETGTTVDLASGDYQIKVLRG